MSAAAPVFRQIPIEEIYYSATNPRQRLNVDAERELLESVERHGVLQPVLVRQKTNTLDGTPYELVAGSRRYRAAVAAGLTTIPAMERVLTDVEVLEIQIIENLQRSDVHPLEEAHAYRLLHEAHGFEVARIAERVGRSIPYVYDRMRLTQMIPDAQEQFRDGRFTAAHAILLARLKPEQQAIAIDPDSMGLYDEEDVTLELDHEDAGLSCYKPRSAREFAQWIDEAFRLDVHAEDLPELFPEVAEHLAEAQDEELQVVEITWSDRLPPSAKDGSRILVSSRWRPADGKTSYSSGVVGKTCDRSKLGVVVIGAERGKTLLVCADKKCAVHWPEQLKAAEQKKAKAPGKPESAKEIAARDAELKKRAAEAKRQAEVAEFRKQWNGALPEIRRALADAIAKASPATLVGYLADVVLDDCSSDWGFTLAHAKKMFPVKKTAEGTLRLAAFASLGEYVSRSHSSDRIAEELKKGLKLDVRAILEAKAAKAAKAAPAKSAAKKKGGR